MINAIDYMELAALYVICGRNCDGVVMDGRRRIGRDFREGGDGGRL